MDDNATSENANSNRDEALDADRDLVESIKKQLPKELANGDVDRVVESILSLQIQKSIHFQGPLPPPEMLANYENVKTGFAERIVKRAEKEQKHRHEIEKIFAQRHQDQLDHKTLLSFRGQLLAFIIAMTVIGGGIYLIAIDKDAWGLSSIIGALAALVTAFIYGKRSESQQSKEESEELTTTQEKS